MTQSLLELAKDLTLSLVETGRLPTEDMQEMLHQTHATLTALKAQEDSRTTPEASAVSVAPVDWRKSITKHAVTCLECGDSFKQLSVRHLELHDLDGQSYRAKYGIPRSQPLAARETTARRREVVRETRPWEKAPTFRDAQLRNGHASPDPEPEPQPETTEAPTAAASATPKRQRNTAPQKKTARKKITQA